MGISIISDPISDPISDLPASPILGPKNSPPLKGGFSAHIGAHVFRAEFEKAAR